MIAAAEMKMGRHEARQAFLEYRKAVREQHNADDEALMRAYGAIARQRRVIDLHGTMRAAGLDEQGRPRLAICRADAEIVFCEVGAWGGGFINFAMSNWRRGNEAKSARITLPPGTFPRVGTNPQNVTCRALVPMIPPRFRPDHAVENYHILWEAEWINAPKDPLLLRHLGKSFYAVVAQWDLTPLEQAVLGAKGPA